MTFYCQTVFINEPASHGFIQFKIKLKQNTPYWSTIKNTAAIFFDFNEPIFTNTTSHIKAKSIIINELNIDLCEGDFYNGINYFENTTVIDTLELEYLDSVIIFHIYILENMETEKFN